MRYQYLLIPILLLFTACGGGGAENSVMNEAEELKSETDFKHSPKTVTIYIHGYQKEGYIKEQNYGEAWDYNFTNQLSEFTELPLLETYDKDNFSNIITAVEYYGDQAPEYYTQADIDEIEGVTTKYGGGIPRYAMILAKFTKHILEETGAEKVNLVSVSMGSLITRWMIEKDIENLASNKKIEKWMTAEGVLRGNYGLSKVDDIGIAWIKESVNSFFEDSAETQHMKYRWIEENLTPNRESMSSPYYSDILVGQISLTDSEKEHAGLKYIMMQEDFQPNDGYQLVKDTYFGSIENSLQVPTHTLMHNDHIGIKDNDSILLIISNFLEAKKRVRITLLDATITDIHETITVLNEDTETVFESKIFSENAKIQTPISERVYDSGTLNIYSYKKDNETKNINQIIFEDFVSPTESTLQVTIEGYEIDRSTKYGISEIKTDKKESMGESINSIRLENGTYPVSADDWSGHVKVEVLEM
ncbi:hypothetical protein GSY74_06605 [Sulfurovum sp. bin170]|uniref:esterase/lipase family protein n=1 Tax=Sulfurovum sp. bin170 TaxID=2695268 RepID=UPI0013E03F24|nr:hypothetical protein [Sulfurovum sp. bin170]NEW60951.1 hypothetical protein [Sulfurovum sp. bin170]